MAGFLLPTFWSTVLLIPLYGPLTHHTARSETTTTTEWASQQTPWMSWEHTCLSLNLDSTVVNNRDVRSMWPRSLTVLVKLQFSISAVRRIHSPTRATRLLEWKMTVLTLPNSAASGEMMEYRNLSGNGGTLTKEVQHVCTITPHLLLIFITGRSHTEFGYVMTKPAAAICLCHLEILGKSTCVK